MREEFYCENCGKIGSLNQQGRCDCCDSPAVLSLALQPQVVKTGIERYFEEQCA